MMFLLFTLVGAINFDNCTDYYVTPQNLSYIGCPKSANWSISNAEILTEGWRLFEVEFFEDIECTQKLKPIQVVGSRSLECSDGSFDVRSAFDKIPSTLWVSACGKENQCGWSQTTEPRTLELRPVPAACGIQRAYLMVSFDQHVAVQCVRIYQASAPFRAEKVVITAHLQHGCYRCADGAIDVTVAARSPNITLDANGTNATQANATVPAPKSPGRKFCSQNEDDEFACYDTLLGRPGLYGRFTNDSALIASYNSSSTINWDDAAFTYETMASEINYPISTNAMVPLPNNSFAVRFTGFLRIPYNGSYTFNILSAGHCRLFLDNATIINNPPGTRGRHSKDVTRFLAAGMYGLSLEYIPLNGSLAGLVFTWKRPAPDDAWLVVEKTYLMQKIMFAETKKVSYASQPMRLCDEHIKSFNTYMAALSECDTMDTCGGIDGLECISGYPTSSISLCRVNATHQRRNESCMLTKLINDATDITTPRPDSSSLRGSLSILFYVFLLFSG